MSTLVTVPAKENDSDCWEVRGGDGDRSLLHLLMIYCTNIHVKNELSYD